jgi:hypothetical protein
MEGSIMEIGKRVPMPLRLAPPVPAEPFVITPQQTPVPQTEPVKVGVR